MAGPLGNTEVVVVGAVPRGGRRGIEHPGALARIRGEKKTAPEVMERK